MICKKRKIEYSNQHAAVQMTVEVLTNWEKKQKKFKIEFAKILEVSIVKSMSSNDGKTEK